MRSHPQGGLDPLFDTHTRHGPGIWLDYANSFSRCSGNLIVETHSKHGGIFLEASDEPNLVDQNVIWKTDGHGIYEHECAGQIFVHNLIAHSTRSGLHVLGRISDRQVDGRTIAPGRKTIAESPATSRTTSNPGPRRR